ncbi:MAG TPA: hypothetical protein VHE80_01715 [Acidimicrobiales bacterium]|nr:hypothetical protein [Acidimicrobiales bacterium]
MAIDEVPTPADEPSDPETPRVIDIRGRDAARAERRRRRADRMGVDDQDARVIDQLWAEYKATASAGARDQLIVHYAPLVKYVAGRVSVGLP